MPCALAAASFSRCFSTYIVLRDKISHRSRVVGGIDRPATVARRVTPVIDKDLANQINRIKLP